MPNADIILGVDVGASGIKGRSLIVLKEFLFQIVLGLKRQIPLHPRL